MTERISRLQAEQHGKLIRQIMLVFRVERHVDGDFNVARDGVAFLAGKILNIVIIASRSKLGLKPIVRMFRCPKSRLGVTEFKSMPVLSARYCWMPSWNVVRGIETVLHQIAVPPIDSGIKFVAVVFVTDFVRRPDVIPLLLEVHGNGIIRVGLRGMLLHGPVCQPRRAGCDPFDRASGKNDFQGDR